MYDAFIAQLREQAGTKERIALHQPVFPGNEKQYLNDAIDSTFVSSVGPYVDKFEAAMSVVTRAPYAIATSTGTAALHVALKTVGVGSGDLVITQPLTFVATCNAIHYCGAEPAFVDIDPQNLGLDPHALERWLDEYAYIDDQENCRHKATNKKISACVPMHSFGLPAAILPLLKICEQWRIPLVEDAAEALGSEFRGQAMGTFGRMGVLSFNGNKIITTGGGGMVLAQTPEDAARVKHLTTTAKRLDDFAMFHDEVGFNYRMPNINAAVGLAQLEQLNNFVARKRALAKQYQQWLPEFGLQFVDEPADTHANFWLITAVCQSKQQRDMLLTQTQASGIETRPAWALMHRLPMYQHCLHDGLTVATQLAERLINLPS